MADKKEIEGKESNTEKKPSQNKNEGRKASGKGGKENRIEDTPTLKTQRKGGKAEKERIPLDTILKNMDHLMPSPDENTPVIPKFSTPKSSATTVSTPNIIQQKSPANSNDQQKSSLGTKTVTFDPIPHYLQSQTMSRAPSMQQNVQQMPQLPQPMSQNMQPVYQGLQQPMMPMPAYQPMMYMPQMQQMSPQMQQMSPQMIPQMQQMSPPMYQMPMYNQQHMAPQQMNMQPQMQQQMQQAPMQQQMQQAPMPQDTSMQANYDDSVQVLNDSQINYQLDNTQQVAPPVVQDDPEEEIDIDELEEQWLEGNPQDLPAPPIVDISQDEGPQDLEGIDLLGEDMGPVPMDELQGPMMDEGWIWDELETDGEEIGPPCSETIKTVADRLWQLGITNTKIMKIKDAYGSFFRPSNIENLTPTQLNTVLTETILPQGKSNRDKLPKSLQNGLIKAALGLVQVFSGIHAPKVPEFEGKRTTLCNIIKVIRILAYLNGKVNFLRRIQMKPYMARQYHKLCDSVSSPSHRLLMGEEFADAVRERNAMFRLGRNVRRSNSNNRSGGGPVNRGRSPGRRDRNQFQPYQQNMRFSRFDRFGNPTNFGEYTPYAFSMSQNVIEISHDNVEYNNFADTINQYQTPADIGLDSQAMFVNPGNINYVNDDYMSMFCSGTSPLPVPEPRLPATVPASVWPAVWQRSRSAPARTQEQGQQRQEQLEWLDSREHHDHTDKVKIPEYLSEIFIKEEFLVGGIAHRIQEWRTLTTDPEILDYVQGVRLDFIDEPVQDRLPHQIEFNKSEAEMVRKEIQRFIKLGILKKSTLCPGDYVSNLFARPKKEPGRVRLILNLKKLNSDWVRFIHFKMDGVEDVINLIKPGVYMASVDFQMSFYSISVHPQYRRFLKAICLGEIYEYQALPMGYSQSPLIFCKLLKVPLSFLRDQYGYTNSAFVDDVFMAEDTIPETQNNVRDTIVTCDDLGYTINMDKSDTVPEQEKHHLGLIFNSVKMTIKLTPDKIEKFIDHAQKILREETHTVRTVASLIGQMNAARYAVRYGPLHTKALEIAKNKVLGTSGKDFDSIMTLSKLDKLDIKWWVDNIADAELFFGFDPIDKVIHTDASNQGYGFWCEATKQRGGGRWSPIEAAAHINPKEIWAVLLGIKSLFPNQRHLHLKVFCDSQVAIQCISKQGSTKSLPCNSATRQLLLYCENHDLRLTMQHIPTDENVHADFESRNFRNEDTEWSLSQAVFDQICDKLQFTPTIDLFADRLNKKVSTYCSWELHPQAAHIDALSTDWTMLNNMFSFSPFSLVGRILHKFLTTPGHRRMLMIVPMWPTQSWYNLILNHTVTVPIIIPVRQGILKLEHKPQKLHPLQGKLRLLAVVISTNPSETRAFQQQWPRLCVTPGQKPLTNSTKRCTVSGKIFVIKNRLVQGTHI